MNPEENIRNNWIRLGCPRHKQKNFGSNLNKPICFSCVSVCFVKPKTKDFGLFRCFKPLFKQLKQTGLFRNKLKQTETHPKFPEKYQNMLSIKLCRSVFCLFLFNRNMESLYFGIEPDSAEISFGSSFGCFESKLVSKDTLDTMLSHQPSHMN